MCGIAGFWSGSGLTDEEMRARAEAMGQALSHRGPDDSGVWCDPSVGLALSHRRLSIVDLSPLGHQPMTSHSGRLVIVFNGEIYNFHEVRRELEAAGQRFKGGSDTEVLVNACEYWGVETSLERLNGMFSFAVWDKTSRRLTLARDRLGKKPLYYGWAGNTFVFGSELKALHQVPSFGAELDRGSLALYLRLGYIPAPHSIFSGVYKLQAAHVITITEPDRRPEPRRYWDVRRVVEEARRRPLSGDPRAAEDAVHDLLSDAVRLRMVADVPVGAFLSGGIDSSLIVALMQRHATAGVKTFTIGFEESTHDESLFASQIARHLGTDHTALVLSAPAALGIIPELSSIYDEPFADPSEIPTFLVSRLARTKITVSLSGDGADELFGGYVEYQHEHRLWRRLQRLAPARDAIRLGLRGVNVLTRGRLRVMEQALGCLTPEALHQLCSSRWREPAELVPDAASHLTPADGAGLQTSALTDPERMMLADLLTYLPEDILTKVDRATMAASLEGRAPFLDYRLVDLAWRLPLDLKIREGQGKWILRSVLRRYVPSDLFERPKMGFNLPLGAWLQGALRPWAESLLDEARLREDGIFAPAPIRRAWTDHLNGAPKLTIPLWGILMFQAWHERWVKVRTSRASLVA